MRNVIIDSGNRKIIDIDIVDVISIISLNKLILGGAAMLIAANKNHHRVIIGLVSIMPFIKYILRV